MALGLTNGAVILSYLVFNEADLDISWTPIKVVNPKAGENSPIEAASAVTMLTYLPRMDCLFVGNISAFVYIVSNFVTDFVGIEI